MLLMVLCQVYYEDNEYAIRLQLAGLRACLFKSATVMHGEFEGSQHYSSGSVTAMNNDSKTRQQLESLLERGVAAATNYLARKWGTTHPPTQFRGPFDSARVPLTEWVLLPGEISAATC